MNKADVARQYRDRYGMDMPTHKLARIMYKEHNLLWADVEAASNDRYGQDHQYKQRVFHGRIF